MTAQTKTPGDLIGETLYKAIKPYHLEGKKRVREASRARSRERKPPHSQTINIKTAVFSVMEAAASHVSSGGAIIFGQRRFYYAVRRLIQPLTSSELTYSYFGDLVQEYQREHGALEGLYFEPRGTLYEPHTNRGVGLGTREVAAYRFPEYVYDKIMFVEKKGQWPLLQAAQLGERYDMAIVAGEGFASEAARVLFSKAEKDQDYQLFVVHDADPSGYEIARTLREATARMPEHSVDVIDLGLTVEEAIDMEDVDPETFTRKGQLPRTLVMNEIEREYFEGEAYHYTTDTGKIKNRVEVQALRAGRYDLATGYRLPRKTP